MKTIKLTSKEMDILTSKYGDGIFLATKTDVENKIGKKIIVSDAR